MGIFNNTKTDLTKVEHYEWPLPIVCILIL